MGTCYIRVTLGQGITKVMLGPKTGMNLFENIPTAVV